MATNTKTKSSQFELPQGSLRIGHNHCHGLKLTKKLLFSLPAGKFIMSNCLTSPQDSVFSAQIKEDSDRELLWKLAKNQGANGRNLHVFDSREDSEEFLAQFASEEGPNDEVDEAV